MRYLKPGRLYCFSPPVMIATFFIEIVSAIYLLYRYQLTMVTKLASIILLCLATFQLAEYNVCEGAFGISSLDWSRLGYVAITLLPPLGIHMIYAIAGKTNRLVVGASYGVAAMFSLFFLTVGHGISASQCLGNYVIFTTAPAMVTPYQLYYYGLLLFSVWLALSLGSAAKSVPIRRALYGLTAGYLAFMVPTTAVNAINHDTMAGIPSIMCGFAVLLALALTFYVVPQYMKVANKGKFWKKLHAVLGK